MKNIEITKMFEIGIMNPNSDPLVCVRILEGAKNVPITPELMGDACIYLYETVLNQCKESSQNEFERKFKDRFDKIWKSKESVETMNISRGDVTEK